MSHFQSAQSVKDKTGRQYHLSVAPNEVAPYILICGDPDRAELVAGFFDQVLFDNRHREYVTITGIYQKMPITVMATGIGCDNTEIAMVEVTQCVSNPTFLRIGTCGALQPQINLGDMVISSGAMRLENTSSWFVPESYPAVAHHQIVNTSLNVAKDLGFKSHLGVTATCSGFYGAQGRSSGGYEPWNQHWTERLTKIGVMNLEMEASTLFVLASLKQLRAGAVCTVYANRVKDIFIDPTAAKNAELNLVKLGLNVMLQLYAADKS